MTPSEVQERMKALLDKYEATNRALVCKLYNALLDIPKADEPQPTQLDLFE